MGELLFVTGGARSGKSAFAERLAAGTNREVVYLATLEALDAEMRERIARHRASRPAGWRTVESPRDLTGALASVDGEACVLLDCLSLWASNRLLALGETPDREAVANLEAVLTSELEGVLEGARGRDGELVVVSNEVGAGLVPEYALGRAYRDLLGRLNQLAAARAGRAWLLVAGRALALPPREG